MCGCSLEALDGSILILEGEVLRGPAASSEDTNSWPPTTPLPLALKLPRIARKIIPIHGTSTTTCGRYKSTSSLALRRRSRSWLASPVVQRSRNLVDRYLSSSLLVYYLKGCIAFASLISNWQCSRRHGKLHSSFKWF